MPKQKEDWEAVSMELAKELSQAMDESKALRAEVERLQVMAGPRDEIIQQRLEACRATVRELRAEVERLQRKHQWHDAHAEDKPYGGPTDMYLITNGTIVSLGYFDLGDQWWDLWEGMHHNDITHWMPIPAPPKKEEQWWTN